MPTSCEAIDGFEPRYAVDLGPDRAADDDATVADERPQPLTHEGATAVRWLLPQRLDHLGHGRAVVAGVILGERLPQFGNVERRFHGLGLYRFR
jgi:hypothetical protein